MKNTIFKLADKVSGTVGGLSAYVPGEQPKDGGWVKLNTNEFPYAPSPRVREAVLRELGDDASMLRLYPDPTSLRLREEIGRHFGVGAEWVMAANGSDDALNIITRAFSDASKPIASFDPSYSLYPVLSQMQGTQFIRIPFKDGLEIDFDKVFGCGANIFYFTNPNAPTAKGFDESVVEKIVEGFDGLVLVDEAYAPFAKYSATKFVKKYPNLIVAGTMSKGWGLAGMRVGWAIANPDIIGILDRVRDSYNLDRLAQAAGIAALSDEDYHTSHCELIKNTRRITEAFIEKIGWGYVKSSANFVFITPRKNGETGAKIAADLYEFLRSKKILLRYFAKDPEINMSLRLSIGTPQQMEIFMKAAGEWAEK